VFITEDLTKKRQFIVQQLEMARRDKHIDSFWTSDGRILYKVKPQDKVHSIRQLGDIDHLLPDPSDQMLNSPLASNRSNHVTSQP
jgi:hypothetical protein